MGRAGLQLLSECFHDTGKGLAGLRVDLHGAGGLSLFTWTVVLTFGGLGGGGGGVGGLGLFC